MDPPQNVIKISLSPVNAWKLHGNVLRPLPHDGTRGREANWSNSSPSVFPKKSTAICHCPPFSLEFPCKGGICLLSRRADCPDFQYSTSAHNSNDLTSQLSRLHTVAQPDQPLLTRELAITEPGLRQQSFQIAKQTATCSVTQSERLTD